MTDLEAFIFEPLQLRFASILVRHGVLVTESDTQRDVVDRMRESGVPDLVEASETLLDWTVGQLQEWCDRMERKP